MKQRILVAVIGIPLLLLVLCWAPHWATAALLAALGVIGAHELLAAVSGAEKTKSLWVLAGFMAVCTVFSTYAGMEAYKGTVLVAVPWLLCASVVLLFLLAVRWFGRENAVAFQDVCAVLLGGAAAAHGVRGRAGADAPGGRFHERLGGAVHRHGLRQAQAGAQGQP